MRRLICAYRDFLCAMHDRYFSMAPQVANAQDVPDFQQIQTVREPFSKFLYQGDINHVDCPYGEVFFGEFYSWWQGLQWGSGNFVSGLELYFSFAISRHIMAPVRTGPKHFKLRNLDVAADLRSCDLATQSHMWLQCLKWWLKCLGQPDQLQLIKGRGLHVFGYTYEVTGFQLRPLLPCSSEVSHAWWRYFDDISGSLTQVRRDLKAPWHIKMTRSSAATRGLT